MRTKAAIIVAAIGLLTAPAGASALEWAQPGITISRDGRSYTTNGSEMVQREYGGDAFTPAYTVERFFAPTGTLAIRIKQGSGSWVSSGLVGQTRWGIHHRPPVGPEYADDQAVDRCALMQADNDLWKVRNARSDLPCGTAKRVLARHLNGTRSVNFRCRRRTHRSRCWRSGQRSNFVVAVETTSDEISRQDVLRSKEVIVCGTAGLGGNQYGQGAGVVLVPRGNEGACADFDRTAGIIGASMWLYGIPALMQTDWACTGAWDYFIQCQRDHVCVVVATPPPNDGLSSLPPIAYWRRALDERGWFQYSDVYATSCGY